MSKSFRIAQWNEFLSNLPLKYQRTFILLIPFISLVMMIGAWLWSRQAEIQAQWWISHTEEIIRESNNLHIQLVDAETGIRGYGITENREFLQPYQQALIEIPKHLDILKKLTKDNPNQQQQLVKIQQQIKERLSLFLDALNVIEANKQTANLDPRLSIILAKSKIKMDDIRISLAQFNDEEWRSLGSHRQHLEQIRKSTNILLATIVLLSLLGYWIAMKLYYHSQNQLEQKANTLSNLNATLASTNHLLEERNQELDRFTYIVSHDLKAPLRAVSNLTDWLEEDLQNKLDDNTRNQLSLLRNRVDRMDGFINGLLQYSRAGRMKTDKTSVDVQKLLTEIIDSLNPPAGFQIKIVNEMPVFEAERLPLQQVFSNLISNAIKHHPRKDGKVEISVSDRVKDYLFTVADDGSGIDPKYHHKVFEIFQTLAARDDKENTGIGLSIVKKIVEDRGGKIAVESQVDQGTTFQFNWNK